jgi:RNA exonuclease 1
VKPAHKVIDYQTQYSGIVEEDLNKAVVTLDMVRSFLLELFCLQRRVNMSSNSGVGAGLLTDHRYHTNIIMGHSLDSDLRCLNLLPLIAYQYQYPQTKDQPVKVPVVRIIDSGTLYPHPRGCPYRISLKKLAHCVLDGKEIQLGEDSVGHDSVEDVCVAMELSLTKVLL